MHLLKPPLLTQDPSHIVGSFVIVNLLSVCRARWYRDASRQTGSPVCAPLKAGLDPAEGQGGTPPVLTERAYDIGRFVDCSPCSRGGATQLGSWVGDWL